jgi:hypothetical protein
MGQRPPARRNTRHWRRASGVDCPATCQRDIVGLCTSAKKGATDRRPLVSPRPFARAFAAETGMTQLSSVGAWKRRAIASRVAPNPLKASQLIRASMNGAHATRFHPRLRPAAASIAPFRPRQCGRYARTLRRPSLPALRWYKKQEGASCLALRLASPRAMPEWPRSTHSHPLLLPAVMTAIGKSRRKSSSSCTARCADSETHPVGTVRALAASGQPRRPRARP